MHYFKGMEYMQVLEPLRSSTSCSLLVGLRMGGVMRVAVQPVMPELHNFTHCIFAC